MANAADGSFQRPTSIERIFNRIFGMMVGAGLGLKHNYLLEVAGRKSGRIYSTPIDLLEVDGRSYLVCPRGRAQWVLNAEARGRVTLRKGDLRLEREIRPVPEDERPDLLRRYLDSFKMTVQRYFPVPAGSPASAFAPIADNYPILQLVAPEDPLRYVPVAEAPPKG
jgi:deazaflavin-dependent oxidoreductase (nitroreductase family)